MSTRCQAFISAAGKPVATIYRHCDGYPTGMGKDLCEIASRTKFPGDMVAKILTAYDFDAELETIDAKHGDTEYEYYVNFPSEYGECSPNITVKSLRTYTTLSGEWFEVLCELKAWQKEN